jgi:hypothetical protein
MIRGAEAFKITVPDGYTNEFRDGAEGWDEIVRFQSSLADDVLQGIFPDLIKKCAKIASKAGIPGRDAKAIESVLAAFKLMVPASSVGGIDSIANAGWAAYHDPTLWSQYPHLVERRIEILNELILKSVEVYEIEARSRRKRDA